MPYETPTTIQTAEYSVSFSPDASLYFDGTVSGTLTRLPGGNYSEDEAAADEIFQRIIDALESVLGPGLVTASKKTGLIISNVTATPED